MLFSRGAIIEAQSQRVTAAGPSWQPTLEKHLEPLLGAFSARMAIRTASLRALKRPLEQLNDADLPALLEGLRPILNTLIGQGHTRAILDAMQASPGTTR